MTRSIADSVSREAGAFVDSILLAFEQYTGCPLRPSPITFVSKTSQDLSHLFSLPSALNSPSPSTSSNNREDKISTMHILHLFLALFAPFLHTSRLTVPDLTCYPYTGQRLRQVSVRPHPSSIHCCTVTSFQKCECFNDGTGANRTFMIDAIHNACLYFELRM